jgi:thioredoxin reductase (NADPH)
MVADRSGQVVAAEPSRPILMTVDDDPAVSRAIARDLRRQYGSSMRIARAERPRDGLDLLRQLKLRGEQVAVILADHRMPEMDGVTFLERAMDIFPLARRALLTAYAETDAAIRAINTVDIDHYLLKPWEPPEVNLYPVVDGLVETWRISAAKVVPELKLIGHRWSHESFELRDFLARNLVPYRWFSADEAEGRRLLSAAGADAAKLPVLITPDGEVLRSPTAADVADRVGLSAQPRRDFYDVVIVGAGPAGLGAAVYAGSEGLRTVLVERQATGGQAGQSSRIENYLGFPDGISGAQLTERARRQAVKFGGEFITAREVVALTTNGSTKVLRFSDGTEIATHTVVLATGVRYKDLPARGVDQFVGRGVYYGSAASEAIDCTGDEVFIVGGANSAGQAAMYFSRYARSVHLVARAGSLDSGMSRYLVDRIADTPNIHVHACTEVIDVAGMDRLDEVTLRDNSAGAVRTYPTHWLFVFIGAAPGTDWLDGLVERDERGFLMTGADLFRDDRRVPWPLEREPYLLETSVPGIFAVGDVRRGSVKRVASAVGEGAMAVSLIHRYLEAQ